MYISIHTFLAEGDHALHLRDIYQIYFNPHLPCGRRQSSYASPSPLPTISIHTFLAEGDAEGRDLLTLDLDNFNPHLPCGRRRSTRRHWPPDVRISIHTFLAEGDRIFYAICQYILSFQSTPSLRKATLACRLVQVDTLHFNPHLPCGRRL